MANEYQTEVHRTPSQELRVHLVDDDPQVLVKLGGVAQDLGYAVSMHRDVQNFLKVLNAEERACVVLDMRLPGVEGMSLLRDLHQRFPDLPVVMISGHGDIKTALHAMRCGALDFLEKPVQREDLGDRLDKAFQFAEQQRQKRIRAAQIRALVRGLTPRELEVMHLLRDGKSVKAVAFDFGVSHKTVQVHRARILDRMHVDSVVDLTNLLHELEEAERDPLQGLLDL